MLCTDISACNEEAPDQGAPKNPDEMREGRGRGGGGVDNSGAGSGKCRGRGLAKQQLTKYG